MDVDAKPRANNPRAYDVQTRFRGGRGPLLIFVGRLVEQNGVGDLIRAVALVTGELADVSLMVLGEGQDRADFEALTASLNLTERVSLLGWVNHDRVPDYLAAADVFVGHFRHAEGRV